MAILDKPVKLLRVDGKSIWEVRRGEEYATHVGEECVSVRPLCATARDLVCLELLHTASSARKLAKRKTEEHIGVEKANHGQMSLIDPSMVELVLRRANIWVSGNPTAEDDYDRIGPKDIECTPILARLNPACTNLVVV